MITVLEGEEDTAVWQPTGVDSTCANMNLLSSCITVASAAIADAGIDCVDVVSGGVAAIVSEVSGTPQVILDPCPSNHDSIDRVCVVAYLQSRDEITEVWAKREGKYSHGEEVKHANFITLLDGAVEAAKAARLVLMEALKESVEAKLQHI